MEGRRQLADTQLQAALNALRTVGKMEYVELKSYMRPPPDIEELFKAIMILFNESQDHSWQSFKKVYGVNLNAFVNKISNFHERTPRLAKRIRDNLTPIIRNRLNYEMMSRLSIAAAHLYNWISNLLNYYEAIEQVTEE